MTKDEKSLLLFFETCVVDNTCKIDMRKMNEEDMKIAKKWNDCGFIRFGRLKYIDLKKGSPNTHFVLLSETAFAAASKLRYKRSLRMKTRFVESLQGDYIFI